MRLKINNLAVFAFSVSSLLFIGCGGDEGKKELTNKPILENDASSKGTKSNVSMFKVGNELFSIPSPIQTAVMLKKSGVNFNGELLSDPKKVASFGTNVQKGLNLGVYGADLGYATIYDKNQEIISFFNATKRLADGLGIANAFDQKLVARFDANMGNQDSLLAMVSDAYRSSDEFLKNNEQEDVGALILCGGYIESLYFSTSIATENNQKEVAVRIAEQKGSLENLIKLYQKHANNEEKIEVLDQLIELFHLFDEVAYNYKWVEPTTDEKARVTQVNSIVDVVITDEQVKAIADKVAEIRNQIIGG